MREKGKERVSSYEKGSTLGDLYLVIDELYEGAIVILDDRGLLTRRV